MSKAKGLLRWAEADIDQGLRQVESALRTIQAHDRVDPDRVLVALGQVNVLRDVATRALVGGGGQPNGASGFPPSEACPRPPFSPNEHTVRLP